MSSAGAAAKRLWQAAKDRRLAACATHAWFALLALGLLLRFADYDEEGWLLAFGYAAQWPVLAALAGALALLCGVSRWPRRAFAAAVLCIFCGALWVRGSWKGNPQITADSAALRFVYWNAAGPQQRLEAVIRHASGFGADFLAIGEAGAETADADARWRAAFPHHTTLRLRGEMRIATAGVVRGTRYGSLRQKGRYNLVEVELRGRPLRVLVVDFDADATRSRRAAFEALQALVAEHAGHPLIVVGDFNTPTDSPHFRRLRGPLQDAWQVAGSGFSETWPLPVPVLRLDHLWISSHLRPVAFRMDWSLLSDHRAQVLDLAWP